MESPSGAEHATHLSAQVFLASSEQLILDSRRTTVMVPSTFAQQGGTGGEKNRVFGGRAS